MIKVLLTGLCLWIASASAQTYTLLTWNIRYDNPEDSLDRWDRRREVLAEEIMDHMPDIIGLQEALVGQLEFLDERLPGYRRFGVGREDGAAKGEFAPIYFDSTRFALVEGRTMWLSQTPDVPGKGWDAACERIATLVILLDHRTGKNIWVVNTHWDHIGAEARMHSASMVHELLAEALTEKEPVILMGDLNATPDDVPIKALGQWLTDSCPLKDAAEATFNGFKMDESAYKRIDYVWTAYPYWFPTSYKVPHPKVKGRHASDHFPVVVKLLVK